MQLTTDTSVLPDYYHFQPSVLLAEDDDSFRALLARELRSDGYRVVDFGSGTAALQCLLTARRRTGGACGFDLIVTDIAMPGITGLDLASVARYDRMPVQLVCLTAFATAETREAARLLGAAAFFDKPFDIDGFRSEIAALLGRV